MCITAHHGRLTDTDFCFSSYISLRGDSVKLPARAFLHQRHVGT